MNEFLYGFELFGLLRLLGFLTGVVIAGLVIFSVGFMSFKIVSFVSYLWKSLRL